MRTILALFTIIILSCTSSSQDLDQDDDYPQFSLRQEKERVDENRALWVSKEISNYQITQQVSCFCVYEYTLPKVFRVVNNELVTINGEEFEENYPTEYLTIPEAFDLIAAKLNQNPDETRIAYDSIYGFPKAFYFDMDERMADEELDVTFSDFAILPAN